MKKPSIYCMHNIQKINLVFVELVKAVLDLSIFGGNRKKDKISRRFEYLQQKSVVI